MLNSIFRSSKRRTISYLTINSFSILIIFLLSSLGGFYFLISAFFCFSIGALMFLITVLLCSVTNEIGWTAKLSFTRRIVLCIISIFFATFYWMAGIGSVAEIGRTIFGVIRITDLYPDAFSAIISNIFDSDPRVFGVGPVGVALVSMLHMVKFFLLALVVPVLIAVTLEARRSSDVNEEIRYQRSTEPK